MPSITDSSSGSAIRRRNLLAECVALAVFVIAWANQLIRGQDPWENAAYIDSFSAGYLWMIAAVAMAIAFRRSHDGARMLFWVGAMTAFMLLAMDEMLEIHELTRKPLGDDDHIKMIAWALTPVAIATLIRIERAGAAVRRLLWAGFLFHSFYAIVEMGDGDYFQLPLEVVGLKWIEEISETVGLACYFLAMTRLFDDVAIAPVLADDSAIRASTPSKVGDTD